jgi:hypothetical protein
LALWKSLAQLIGTNDATENKGAVDNEKSVNRAANLFAILRRGY